MVKGVGCEYTIVKGVGCRNTMVKGVGCGNTMVKENHMKNNELFGFDIFK